MKDQPAIAFELRFVKKLVGLPGTRMLVPIAPTIGAARDWIMLGWRKPVASRACCCPCIEESGAADERRSEADAAIPRATRRPFSLKRPKTFQQRARFDKPVSLCNERANGATVLRDGHGMPECGRVFSSRLRPEFHPFAKPPAIVASPPPQISGT